MIENAWKCRPASWYDAYYTDERATHTREPQCNRLYSHYIRIISEILDPVRRDAGIVEIGCGAGEFAELLWQAGFQRYQGFDFSSKAVDLARARLPDEFYVGVLDVEKSAIPPADVYVCIETMEHLGDDTGIFSKLNPGALFAGMVPSFDGTSHVRFFLSAPEVQDRYGPYLDKFDVRKSGDMFIFSGLTKNVNL